MAGILDEIMGGMEQKPATPAPAAASVVVTPPAPGTEEKRIHQYKDQFEREYPEKK